ncbi:hypothetical protein [Dysgonomonas sp. HGC4]|uniref:hypothetical protein n=1 Tax=Dysgonomonas sp. HGC4 TaxID=1658009 RepID=UPI000680F788|nr:hypothetical protein [Dysgonomonas sp. HGC4]MBD8349284.1 hypothetical protein [Dysgonomonas sp. HGC4]
MWIAIVIIAFILLVVIRSIYRYDGHYQLLNEKGIPIHTGTYRSCVESLNSYKVMGWGKEYTIKRMKF